jgi:cellulose synthase/poly-beta-1,6-N-acetylglucosamine synthase-like glycosyltransferase
VEEEYVAKVKDFVRSHPEVALLRRSSRGGYKAGNLNHAFRHALPEGVEWAVVVDADDTLPGGFLPALASAVAGQPERVAFVQAAHLPDHLRGRGGPPGGPDGGPTVFQRMMGPEVQLFYERDLCHRGRFGFVPFLGHGAAIRRGAWDAVGGFPEVVSEDFAFAIRLRLGGWYGVYAGDVASFESFPRDFGAFLVRLRKFSGGTAELARGHLWGFLRGGAGPAEKVDLLMLVLWYFLTPLVFIKIYIIIYL